MPFSAQTQKWKPRSQGGKGKALLLVHGIGDPKPGSYNYLLPHVKQALGSKANDTAIYTLYYDFVNDWFKDKTQLESVLSESKKWLGQQMGGTVASIASEVVADVFWPVLSLAARKAVQEAYAQQLQRMVLDGIDAGFPPDFQSLSILCHSLGCFHTYEMLHRCAKDEALHLHPVKDGVRFASVVFMASPVQLIRSVAGALNWIIPEGLACLDDKGLSGPKSTTPGGSEVSSVGEWISVTGALDPVGGHVFRKKLPWAYMDVPAANPFKGQQSVVDPQDWISAQSEAELRLILQDAFEKRQAGKVPLNDPHSWSDYINRHSKELEGWLCA
jgi:hypothetical protein